MSMPPDTGPAIEACGLSKTFGERMAVDELMLTVERGEIFGFLGPNGAGKTTSIKMLLGLIKPNAGSGRLLGSPLGDHRIRARVGFLPEHFRFHEWLTAREFLDLHAGLYGMPEERSRNRIPELLERLGLLSHSNKALGEFSKGMLQRIGLAQALLNNPDLIFLDEPTSGLDPIGRVLVRDIIRELRQQGSTVFLNSHLLGEVEVTCDRVAFIKHGQVVRMSSLQTLEKGNLTVELRVRGLQQDVLAGLAQWGQNVRTERENLYLTIESEESLPEIHRYLANKNVDVYWCKAQRASLETLFMETIGNDGGL
jgi:ABC-2 type transport system ATP-binding protein